MAHSTVVDVQTELVRPGTTFTVYGTGRHRGPEAEDDQRCSGDATVAGHGRHRRVARTSPARPVDGIGTPWV
ncbi:hypothetical protein OHT61_30965 [Streptomyces sp. NBC_00178]|uniref:hypothetical protein n=1 Tax=Streptomyces sp. NBC_00178 TaxID=2975672 RepID=UPI002E2B430A|nr:hypothetical protein [Streptomyces sp. NBC_00178]